MSYLSARNTRLALGAIGIGSVFFAPPWVPLLVMVVLAIRYPAWEVPLIGLAVDLLWFTPGGAEGLGTLPFFTIAGIALVWGFELLRREFLMERTI